MSIQELLRLGSKQLLPLLKDSDTAHLESELLLAYVLNKERTWLITHDDFVPTKRLRLVFQRLLARRLTHEPVAYLTRQCAFFGRSFYVDKRVLIPRPETEELVITALDLIKEPSKTLAWDVGTGSGAIAISIKTAKPNAQVIASDIEAGALTVAKKNARAHHAPIHFSKGNLLSRDVQTALQKSKAAHLLFLANLPYVPLSDKRTLMADVIAFEPHTALFAKQHGQALISHFLLQASRFHKRDKRPLSLVLEFDPPQAARLKKDALRLFPRATTRILQDTCGRDRLLVISSM